MADLEWLEGGVTAVPGFLAGGIAAARMIPAPAWFVVLDLAAAYVPMAFLGALLGRRLAGPKS